MEKAFFTFIHVPNRVCKALEENNTKDFLMKWSMKGNIQIQYYCFNQPFQINRKEEFVESFFKDPAVYSTFIYNQTPVGEPASSISVEIIPCTILSMDFFDRLIDSEKGVVRCDKKMIVQCQEENVNGFFIDDNLRHVVLNEENELYQLYSESDRKQFLWRVFSHLCLGGEWCQYEFSIEPYLNTTKLLYKDLVSVERVGDTSELVVRSLVLKVQAYDVGKRPLVPTKPDNMQNFVYLIVDAFKRTVTVFSHCYGGQFCV